jgi:hypothetical protein
LQTLLGKVPPNLYSRQLSSIVSSNVFLYEPPMSLIFYAVNSSSIIEISLKDPLKIIFALIMKILYARPLNIVCAELSIC